MEGKFFSLTVGDVMHLVYQLAVRNGIKNEFCNEKDGRKWLNTLSSYQEIPVQTLLGPSLSRANK
jgi:hypothetical protein